LRLQEGGKMQDVSELSLHADLIEIDKFHLPENRRKPKSNNRLPKKTSENTKIISTALAALALSACGGDDIDESNEDELSGNSNFPEVAKPENPPVVIDTSPSLTNQNAIRSIDLTAQPYVIVNTDVKQISSLSEYAIPETELEFFEFNRYSVSPKEVIYPAKWLGSYGVDFSPAGSLKENYTLAVSIKDILSLENPNFVKDFEASNAKNDTFYDAIDQALESLSTLGVQHTIITQWSWATENSDGSFSILKPDFAGLNDEQFRYVVESAATQGITVGTFSQIQGFTNGFEIYFPEINEVNIQKWHNAYMDFVEDRSVFFEDIGITQWEIGCDFCAIGPLFDSVNGGQNYTTFLENAIEFIDLARTNFSGEISMWPFFDRGLLHDLASDPYVFMIAEELYNKVDSVYLNVSVSSSSDDVHRALQEILKADDVEENVISYFVSEFENSIENIRMYSGLYDKIYVNISLQSREDVFENSGYMEETGDTAAITTTESKLDDLIYDDDFLSVQKLAVIDFSIQALYFEAAFRSLSNLDVSSEIVVVAGDYFLPAHLLPEQTYPNLASSIRHKPAEYVVYKWFEGSTDTAPDILTSDMNHLIL
jgi:hypothetical protein